ncbi:MAG: hypothetical protein ACTSQZ_07310, partial [Candidatus Thorarchaeota archaeon]
AKYEIRGFNTTNPGQYDFRNEVKVIRDDESPLIDEPLDMQFYVDDISDDLIWNIADENPAEYVIRLNGSVIASGIWTSNMSSIVVSLEGLDVGCYNYTIEVIDFRMNTATDSVIVTIMESSGISISNWLSILTTIGALGVIVVVCLLILRSRK